MPMSQIDWAFVFVFVIWFVCILLREPSSKGFDIKISKSSDLDVKFKFTSFDEHSIQNTVELLQKFAAVVDNVKLQLVLETSDTQINPCTKRVKLVISGRATEDHIDALVQLAKTNQLTIEKPNV